MSEPMPTIPTQSPFTYPNPNPSASPSFTQDDTSESFIPEPTQPMPTFTQTAFSQPAFSQPNQSIFSQPAVHFQQTQPTQTNQTGQQYPNNVQSQQFQQFQTATISANNAKFPYLEKEKYEIWAMKMEYWIQNADHNLWRIVQQGNSPKRLGKDAKGNTIVHPPVSLDEHVAVQRENKVRTLLLQALPEDHMPDFHHYDDARDIWMAVKARFGGNEESKKMRKTMLKQQFTEFSVTEEEGLHKGYDRFQKILSQLNQVQARPDNDDINLKFLRALPSSWSQVALALKTRGGLESMSFDDLYNKLRSLELDVRIGHSYGVKAAAAPTHSAFIGAASSGSKLTYSDQQSIVPSVYQTSGRSDNIMECVLHSFVAENEPDQEMIYEDFDQVDQLEMEELDLKWQMAMLSLRINRFEKKAGRKMNYNNQQPARFDRRKVRCYKCLQLGHFARECNVKTVDDKARYSAFKVTEVKTDEPKALVSVDSMVNWSDHAAENKTGEVEKVYGMMAGLHADNGGADASEAAAEFAMMGISPKVQNCPLGCDSKLNDLNNMYNNLDRLYNDCYIKVQAYQNAVKTLESQKDCVFTNSDPVDNEDKPLYSRFVKRWGNAAVPPPITGTYMPSPYQSDIRRNIMGVFQTQRPHASCDNAFKNPDQEYIHLPVDIQTFPESDVEIPTTMAVLILVPCNLKQTSVSCDPVSAVLANPAARNHFFRPSSVYNTNWSNIYDPMIKGRWGTAVKTSAGIVETRLLKKYDRKHSKKKKKKLDDFVQIKGGIVKFGGGDGRISGKGTIRTSKLDFENVYYVEELQHFNLFSVSQICDKKNKVLFTDTDCLVLSEEFQLPDASQVVLRIPRKHDLYTFHISDRCNPRTKGTHETNINAGTQDHDSDSEVDEQLAKLRKTMTMKLMNSASRYGYFLFLTSTQKYYVQAEAEILNQADRNLLVSKSSDCFSPLAVLDVKSAFSKEKLKKKCKSLSLKILKIPYSQSIIQVVKALYGLHQHLEPAWFDEFDVLDERYFEIEFVSGEDDFFLGLQNVINFILAVQIADYCVYTSPLSPSDVAAAKPAGAQLSFLPGRLVDCCCTNVLLVVIFLPGRLGFCLGLYYGSAVSFIFSAGRIWVSAGCTMVLLVVIFSADWFLLVVLWFCWKLLVPAGFLFLLLGSYCAILADEQTAMVLLLANLAVACLEICCPSFDSAVHRDHAGSFDAAVTSLVSAASFVPAVFQSSCFEKIYLETWFTNVPADYVSAVMFSFPADRDRILADYERIKSIALKAKKESSDDETSTSGSDDEEYAMAVRRMRLKMSLEEKMRLPNHLMGDCPKHISKQRSKCLYLVFLEDSENDAEDKTNDETCLMAQSSNKVCLRTCLEPDEWIKDSGCSKHMTGNKSLFSTYKAYDGEHVDNLAFNLLSVGQICDNKCQVLFTEDGSEIIKDGKIIGNGIRKNGLYVMKLGNKSQDKLCLATVVDNSTLWHRRLGHANMRLIQSLSSKELVRNLPKLKYDKHFCDACKIGKQAHTSHKAKNMVSTKRCLELLHMDLFGPSAIKSYGGNLYTLVVVDDYSRYTWTRFLKTKNEAFEKFEILSKKIQNQLGSSIIAIRTDHGREFDNEVQFEAYCDALGITHNFSAPRTPQSNGVVERKNRTLQEMSRTMLNEQSIP
ncbi:ribonuclease H-like domain-containing protein [Tanacetum coccineum]